MKKFKLKLDQIVFWVVFVFGIYHLSRDVMQILNIETIFSQFAKKEHEWAKVFGDFHEYLSLPLDLIMIFGSLIILRRDRIGKLGIIVFCSVILLALMWIGK